MLFRSTLFPYTTLFRSKALHTMNKLRVPFVRDGLINAGTVKPQFVNTSEPLKGLTILDVGCGGGILCEPLARLGAKVTGIDATAELIVIAKEHVPKEPEFNDLLYLHTTVEEHAKTNLMSYDAVVASEVIEHVLDKPAFIKACINCLKPNGSIFITTLNKTYVSYFGGVLIAENVLRLLPVGTHNWNLFISPPQLQRMLEDHKCRTRAIHGMVYNPITNTWKWSAIKEINYALHAIKL